MGIDIRAHCKGGKSYTLGAGQFKDIRNNIAKYVLKDNFSIYVKWLATNSFTTPAQLDKICRALYTAGGDALYNFLTQPDFKGGLSKSQVEELYYLIEPDNQTNYSLCYIASQSEATKNQFKELLQYCIEHQVGLKWS